MTRPGDYEGVDDYDLNDIDWRKSEFMIPNFCIFCTVLEFGLANTQVW